MYSKNGYHHPNSRTPTIASLWNSSYGPSMRNLEPASMSYPPQPVEMDPSHPRNSSSYHWDTTMYSVPSGSTEQSASLHRQSSIKPLQALVGFSSATSQHPLQSWYSNNDGPWIPRDALVEIDPRLPSSSHPVGYASASNQKLPSRRFPVEGAFMDGGVMTGKPQSDSGYGSLPSMETSSIRSYDVGNRARESLDFFQRNHDLQQGDPQSVREMRKTHPAPARIPLSGPAVLRCPTCQKTVKTQSELKKHDARHRRPFACEHLRCPRNTQGFGTRNDLDRHIRSKHPEDRLDGRPGQVYFCPIGPCKVKNRKFPRLDNFRNHLKRLHHLRDDEVEGIRRDAEQKAATDQETHLDEPFYEDGPSIGIQDDILNTSLESSHAMDWSHESIIAVGHPSELPELDNTLIPDLQAKVPYSGESVDGSPVLVGTHIGGPSAEEPSPIPEAADLMKPSPGSETASPTPVGSGNESTTSRRGKVDVSARKVLAAALAKAGVGKSKKSIHDSGESNAGDNQDSDGAILSRAVTSPSDESTPDGSSPGGHTTESQGENAVEETLDVAAILSAIHGLGYVLKKAHPAASSTSLPDASGKKREREPIQTCPECQKFSGRPCELKKHMKRHSRPYGCTVAGCNKPFGSKDDWKRHENSQHFRHETWRCGRLSWASPCTKTSYHLEAFKAHLQRSHGVGEADVGRRAAEARYVERDFPRSFWCGFCEGMVEMGEGDAWTERFNHVDDHFMGRRGRERRIEEWTAEPGTEVGERVEETASASSASSASPSDATCSPSSSGSPPQQAPPATVVPSVLGKRGASGAPEKKAAKQHRTSKEAMRIVCCQCSNHYNRKTSTECDIDRHLFCELCVVRRVDDLLFAQREGG